MDEPVAQIIRATALMMEDAGVDSTTFLEALFNVVEGRDWPKSQRQWADLLWQPDIQEAVVAATAEGEE